MIAREIDLSSKFRKYEILTCISGRMQLFGWTWLYFVNFWTKL